MDKSNPFKPRPNQRNVRNVIVGVVSHGGDCDGKNLPEFYTRVKSYLKWITDVIRNDEICYIESQSEGKKSRMIIEF